MAIIRVSTNINQGSGVFGVIGVSTYDTYFSGTSQSQANIPSGRRISIEANGVSGYEITGCTGGASYGGDLGGGGKWYYYDIPSTVASRSFEVQYTKTTVYHTVTAVPNNSDWGTVNPQNQSVQDGYNARTITATAKSGYEIVGYELDGVMHSGDVRELTLTNVRSDHRIVWQFYPINTRTVTVHSTDGGSTTPGSGQYKVTLHNNFTVTAAPQPHYYFVRFVITWLGTPHLIPTNPFTVTDITDDVDWQAVFSQYSSIRLEGEDGVTNIPRDTYYEDDLPINLSIEQRDGYRIVGFTVDNTQYSGSTLTWDMVADLNPNWVHYIRAVYEPIKIHITFEVDPSDIGYVSLQSGGRAITEIDANYGEQIRFFSNNNDPYNYKFNIWVWNDGTTHYGHDLVLVMTPVADCTIKLEFVRSNVTIKATTNNPSLNATVRITRVDDGQWLEGKNVQMTVPTGTRMLLEARPSSAEDELFIHWNTTAEGQSYNPEFKGIRFYATTKTEGTYEAYFIKHTGTTNLFVSNPKPSQGGETLITYYDYRVQQELPTPPAVGALSVPYPQGEWMASFTVTLHAIPNEGWRFVKWEDGTTRNPIQKESNRWFGGDEFHLHAYFEPIDDYFLTLSSPNTDELVFEYRIDDGEWQQYSYPVLVPHQANVQFRANAWIMSDGERKGFLNWSDGETDRTHSTIVMDSSKDFVGYYNTPMSLITLLGLGFLTLIDEDKGKIPRKVISWFL